MIYSHWTDVPDSAWQFKYFKPYEIAKVGGAPLSSHLKGHAFDVKLGGRDKEVIHRIAKQCGFTGFGLKYNTFIHIDMGRRREW